MKDTRKILIEKAAGLLPEVKGYRRHFHMNPELSFEEHQTADYICRFLDEQGINYRRNIAGEGIIAEIRAGSGEGRIIAIRAEMDALPITEKNQVEYASRIQGKMHACGHDSHLAMLMGTVKILNELKNTLHGRILIIFQPGEELSPGGARLMIESGAFNDPKPEIVLAQHVLPELETGKVGYRAGRYMASSDEIYLTITGKGGHAALPGASTDQIYIASKLILMLKDQVAEAASARNIPTVLGIGKIRGDGATNVIPEKVEIAGTFRTFNEEWRADAKALIKKISAELAQSYGVNIDVRIADGYPVLVNNEELTEKAIRLSTELLGSENVEMFDIRMSSEDFAFFTEVFPSVYLRAGIRKKGATRRNLHTPDFDIDEEGMATGIANMCWLAINFLNDK
ncbi:MAG: M20 family metallopeptidase [Bacteroidales bacterium]